MLLKVLSVLLVVLLFTLFYVGYLFVRLRFYLIRLVLLSGREAVIGGFGIVGLGVFVGVSNGILGLVGIRRVMGVVVSGFVAIGRYSVYVAILFDLLISLLLFLFQSLHVWNSPYHICS